MFRLSNGFTRDLPFSINNLNSLNNGFFSGGISSDGLDDFNVSDNRVYGSIPQALYKFKSSPFTGNLALSAIGSH